MARPRLRDIGIRIGDLPPGEHNAITDVRGVSVGHATLVSGEGRLRPERGPVRTGVTVILPHGENLFRSKARAAVHTINGFGKAVGFEQVRELGVIEAPVALTNTLNVGLVLDALVEYSIRQNPEIGVSAGSVNIVVGETNDGYLNDLQGRHVRREHVLAALEAASDGPVAEGSVGAGTGTCCLGWKGGIGTASRRLPQTAGGFTLGALVQSNFGRPGELVIAGCPVGRSLSPPKQVQMDSGAGSIMIVLATDAPLSSLQLERVCRRAVAGLVNVGSRLENGSGDFVIAFSTVNQVTHDPPAMTTQQTVVADEARVLNALFRAAIESTEEAVLNSLCAAETVVGRDGHTAYALPLDQVLELLQIHHGAAEHTEKRI